MERRTYEPQSGATQREQIGEAGASMLDTAADRAVQAGDKAVDLAQRPLAGERAAGALDRSGRYLQTTNHPMLRNDLERVIRDHPIEALRAGIRIGYLADRITRR
jgi:hypothetical protein